MSNRKPDELDNRLSSDPVMGPMVSSYKEKVPSDARLAENFAQVQQRIYELERGKSYRRWSKKQLVVVFALMVLLLSTGVWARYFIWSEFFESVLPAESSPAGSGVDESKGSPPKAVAKQLSVPDNIASDTAAVNTDMSASQLSAPETERTASKRLGNNTRMKTEDLLAAQVRLFEKAKAATRQGNCKHAISVLNRLDRQYKNGALAYESRELRSKCLYRMGAFSSCASLTEQLIQETRAPRKRARLYRFLGDTYRKLGSCDHAVHAYQSALGLGLSGGEAQNASRGIQNCRDLDSNIE